MNGRKKRKGLTRGRAAADVHLGHSQQYANGDLSRRTHNGRMSDSIRRVQSKISIGPIVFRYSALLPPRIKMEVSDIGQGQVAFAAIFPWLKRRDLDNTRPLTSPRTFCRRTL